MKVISMFKKEGVVPVTIAATVALFLIVSAVQATTTISTDITTEGAFTVSGTGATTLGGVLSVTGKTTLVNASTTLISNSGAAWVGGTLTVSTTNAATSTTSIGCLQTTATSTATPIKLRFHASTTVADVNGVAQNGFVVWSYGNCP